jgi:hypothetical protein
MGGWSGAGSNRRPSAFQAELGCSQTGLGIARMAFDLLICGLVVAQYGSLPPADGSRSGSPSETPTKRMLGSVQAAVGARMDGKTSPTDQKLRRLAFGTHRAAAVGRGAPAFRMGRRPVQGTAFARKVMRWPQHQEAPAEMALIWRRAWQTGRPLARHEGR